MKGLIIVLLAAFVIGCSTTQTPSEPVATQPVINEPIRPPRQANPRIHRDVQTIVMKCLEKLPGNRYLSAADPRDDIRRFRAGEAIRARPVGIFRRCGRHLKRNSLFIGAAASVLLALTFFVWQGLEFRSQQKRNGKELRGQKTVLKLIQKAAAYARFLAAAAASRIDSKVLWRFNRLDGTASDPHARAFVPVGSVGGK